MLRALSLLVFFFGCSFSSSPDQHIVGGITADIANFKYQGSLRRGSPNKVHVCGCVLVSPQWAVTAAQCNPTTNDDTEWGTSTLGQGTERAIIGYELHPDHENYNNDIAVLLLESPVSGDNIAPIRMASYRLDSSPAADIVGWGLTCSTCGSNSLLHTAKIPVITDIECSGLWGNSYDGNIHMCGYDPDEGVGTCNGDSGSALVADSQLHGLASFQEPNCNVTWPSVYTRISTVRIWVCGATASDALGC